MVVVVLEMEVVLVVVVVVCLHFSFSLSSEIIKYVLILFIYVLNSSRYPPLISNQCLAVA